MKYLYVMLVCSFWLSASGQEVEKDERAAEILKQVEARVHQFEDVRYDFTLDIHIPEQEPIIQEGTYLQKGSSYRLELPHMISMANGTSQWFIDRDMQEVQIHDFVTADETNLMNPSTLLAIYDNPNFAYQLYFDGPKGGKEVQEIEFKPTDRFSEYAKARLTVDKQDHRIRMVEVFGKDGTRYLLTINNMEGNTNPQFDVFTFDAGQYEGYHVEDLRIN